MHAAVLYRRSVLEETGGFDPRLSALEDYEMYLRRDAHASGRVP